GYLSVSTEWSLGTVFTANISGAAYYGTVPAGSKIPDATGTQVAAKTGDFYLSAQNVTLNVGGFKGSGGVYFGKAGGVFGASMNGSIQILGTSGSNSVDVKGSILGIGDFTLSGAANLDLVGFKPRVTVTVAKTG